MKLLVPPPSPLSTAQTAGSRRVRPGPRSRISQKPMTDAPPQDYRIHELRAAISWLRNQITPGSPIVPLATVRARDRAEPTHGIVLSLGLASSLFHDEQFGDYIVMDKPHIHLFDGILSKNHIASLLPLFEHVARDRMPLLLAARDADEDVLAMVALNKQRGSMRGAIVTTPAGRGAPLRDLHHATGGGVGTANEVELRVGEPALPQRLLATLDETVIITPRPTLPSVPTLGLLYVGGEDLPAARHRARVAREILGVRSLN
ncbi:MAG: hypothetical protein L6Q76_07900 [Polyangiaceae bacterium]|nr:hypothetical protein [Polyangiaceae bacterium]